MKLLITASIVLTVTAWASAQRPADPVGHPAGYQSFQQVRTIDRKQDPTHGTVFLNAPAATIGTRANRIRTGLS